MFPSVFRLQSLTVRARVIVCSLLGTVLCSIYAIAIVLQYREEAQENKLVDVGSQAAQLGAAITAQFFERYGDVQAFAANSVFHSNDVQRLQETLNRYVELYRIYDLILFVDKDGKFIASNTTDAEGKPIAWEALAQNNYAREPWFDNAVRGSFSNEPANGLMGTFVEDVAVDKLSSLVYRTKRLGTAFTTWVKNPAGEVTGVLSSRANFRWAEQEFKGFYETLAKNGFASSELTLINKRGEVIIDYDPSENNGNREVSHDFERVLFQLNLVNGGVEAAIRAVKGESGHMKSFHTRKKAEQFTGYQSLTLPRMLGSLGWSVLVRTSVAEVMAKENRTTLWTSLGLGVIALGAVLTGVFVARTIQSSLAEIANHLVDSATQVASAGNQLSATSQLLSNSATQSAASVEETMSSLESLSGAVTRTAHHAGEAKNNALEARSAATRGEEASKKLSVSMGAIVESSQKIESIISLIDGLAFQTNLLALNAAVEAARAGEKGRGFAVVAEAVRDLAARSAAAAKDIAGLIQESVQKSGQGAGIVSENQSHLQRIAEETEKVSGFIHDIAQESQHQSQGMSEITRAMEQIDRSIQTTAANAEESAAASEELASQAALLHTLVGDLTQLIYGSRRVKNETGNANA